MECPKLVVKDCKGKIIYEHFFKESNIVWSDELLVDVHARCGDFCPISNLCLKLNGEILYINTALNPGDEVEYGTIYEDKDETSEKFVFVSFGLFECIPFPVHESGCIGREELLQSAKLFFEFDDRFTYHIKSLLNVKGSGDLFYAGDHLLIEADEYIFSFSKERDEEKDEESEKKRRSERQTNRKSVCKKLNFTDFDKDFGNILTRNSQPSDELYFVDVDVSSLNLSIINLRFRVFRNTTYEILFDMLSKITFSHVDRVNIPSSNITSDLYEMRRKPHDEESILMPEDIVIPFLTVFINRKNLH